MLSPQQIRARVENFPWASDTADKLFAPAIHLMKRQSGGGLNRSIEMQGK